MIGRKRAVAPRKSKKKGPVSAGRMAPQKSLTLVNNMAYSAQKCTLSIEVRTGGTEGELTTSFARFEGQSNLAQQYGINSSSRFNAI